MEEHKQEAIILYPSPPIGHLISMIELAKLIHSQNSSLSIHIILVPPPYKSETTADYISSVSSSFSSITFHRLPPITPSPNHKNLESILLDIISKSNQNIHKTLFSLTQKFNLQSLIIDFFCTPVFNITSDFTFPIYFFYTSNAAALASHLYLPTLDEITIGKNLKDVEIVEIPGVSTITGLDMPPLWYERDDELYKAFVEIGKKMLKSSGIIVNTFQDLEAKAIKGIKEEICFRNVYAIGPLIVHGRDGDGDEDSCLAWLHLQPDKSVVFLCFGSLGLFSEQQLKEIALGLERSGQRFLWVVRNPPELVNRTEIAFNSLLPEGFLDRTGNRGLVVKSWAPQVAVLNHKAVGGFVTHCGWNSILESICAGVPMVAWPLYAEQRFNRVLLVKEIRIGIPMNESETGFVSSTEVERRVREILQDGPVREMTKKMKNAAELALTESGSSRIELTELLKSWSLEPKTILS